MCEPLKNKTKHWIADGRKHTIDKIKKDVASAVKFYEKYITNPKLLKEKESKAYNLFKKWFEKNIEDNYRGDLVDYLDRQDMNPILNHWLFRYTFQDVIE